jgi:hypothetical protein
MKLLMFLGTVRSSTPPKPARLGLRVARACLECLECLNSRYEIHVPREKVDPHKRSGISKVRRRSGMRLNNSAGQNLLC